MAPNIWGPSDKESEIRFLVQKLTTTGKKILDESKMKKLKSICKLSDKYVNCAYYALMTQLRKDHAEVRYSSLLIVNELFTRSSVFRSKLEYDFEEFLELVEGTDPEKPLPLPAPVAKDLKIKGLEFIRAWANKYGEKYIRLPLAVNYLKKCRKVDFNDMEARNVAQRERQRQENERSERLINEKICKIGNEMKDLSDEISSIATQMENCFRLLIPHPSDCLFSSEDFEPSIISEACMSNNSGEDVSETVTLRTAESSSVPENRLRDHGLHNMKKNITIEVKKDSEVSINANEDTSPIIENLKDLEKQICSRYYPVILRWLKILAKGSNCSDLVKKAIDLKLILESNLEKYKELKITPSKVEFDTDEEDDFVEVEEKDGYEEQVKTPALPSTSASTSHLGEVSQWQLGNQDDIKDPTTAASNVKRIIQKVEFSLTSSDAEKLESLKKKFKRSELSLKNIGTGNLQTLESSSSSEKSCKAKLLEKAPVLPYDIDLYHWEEEKPLIPERLKFDHLHKFLESKKDDDEDNETLKELQLASLRTRKIDFSGKFEPVKWDCRAPLPNGKLCPRKDRYKCPFHGKIIPRDVMGNPSGDSTSMPGPSSEPTTSAVPDWQDPSLLREIEAATGIDLKIPDKKSKKVRKKDGLTNIKQINNTVRERLSKKIIKRYRHYARKLDETERNRFNDKFGDQWNYY